MTLTRKPNNINTIDDHSQTEILNGIDSGSSAVTGLGVQSPSGHFL